MAARRGVGVWLALVLLGWPSAAAAQRAIVIVRHAERLDQSEDAPLSQAGEARAAALARQLRDAGVGAIYATQWVRTRRTAEPLARARNLPIETVPSRDTAALVDRLRTRHADDVVLVVGHSNTLPEILRALGHEDPVTIADDEYDNLFVVVPRPTGPPLVLRLRF